ncbi:unnamed protein product [Rangifer tarandus platyrhynchus]|uniref:Uncharacterized protein n=2 Tax=Rangifer tarandus platyrhynchus TaxID=3082113 RepID=A0ACB0E6Q3_RANTA|nr:unnamed protein product [Rangifer tarandus platyrhynchus]CAI9696133.1 unnamed protein product [Rangifer tarandus platyrhynchus]
MLPAFPRVLPSLLMCWASLHQAPLQLGSHGGGLLAAGPGQPWMDLPMACVACSDRQFCLRPGLIPLQLLRLMKEAWPPAQPPSHATENCNLASSSNAEAGAQSRICDIKASQQHWGASRSPSASAPGPLPTGLD